MALVFFVTCQFLTHSLFLNHRCSSRLRLRKTYFHLLCRLSLTLAEFKRASLHGRLHTLVAGERLALGDADGGGGPGLHHGGLVGFTRVEGVLLARFLLGFFKREHLLDLVGSHLACNLRHLAAVLARDLRLVGAGVGAGAAVEDEGVLSVDFHIHVARLLSFLQIDFAKGSMIAARKHTVRRAGHEDRLVATPVTRRHEALGWERLLRVDRFV